MFFLSFFVRLPGPLPSFQTALSAPARCAFPLCFCPLSLFSTVLFFPCVRYLVLAVLAVLASRGARIPESTCDWPACRMTASACRRVERYVLARQAVPFEKVSFSLVTFMPRNAKPWLTLGVLMKSLGISPPRGFFPSCQSAWPLCRDCLGTFRGRPFPFCIPCSSAGPPPFVPDSHTMRAP